VQILLFYTYVFIEDPVIVRDWLRSLCIEHCLKGRLIVSKEGLNCTLEGETEKIEAFIRALEEDARFRGIHFKKSPGTGTAFPKLSVKTRSEIVSLQLGTCDIDPNTLTGKRCTPDMLHDWFSQQKEFYIVDMRNVYEHAVGKFSNSICPSLENFRDLPKLIKSISHLKDKTVLTVCTGGVRCEKASGFLMSQGFKDVWQLDGGIVSYMEKYPNEHFEGKLYVFDTRVVMGFYTNDSAHKIIGTCEGCHQPSEQFVNCGQKWCGRHFILCNDCGGNQKKDLGQYVCPKRCTLRKPKKVSSPAARLFIKLKTVFA
jgi:UPF0176 protein